MRTTELCKELKIELPIWNAGLGGGLASAELAAAVSEAGGLGVLGMGGLPPEVVQGCIRQLRSLTSKPFGVNLLIPLLGEGVVECCLEERVPVLVFFWGDPSPYVEAAHRVGTLVVLQCGSTQEAVEAVRNGVDAVIVQGVEAGGHVRGTTALSVLLPATVEALGDVPVIAAGGIADGRGVAAALSMGAQAVSLGTRFLCSDESRGARSYKERIVAATAEDTVHTKLFDVGWPDAAHRVLRNRAVTDQQFHAGGPREGEGDVVGRMTVAGEILELPRFGILPPHTDFEGDLEHATLYSGQSCALINDIRPAGDIVRTLAAEADEALARSLND